MTFNLETDRIPSALGEIKITLVTNYDLIEGQQRAYFSVHVLDQDGRVLTTVDGDLVPHITQVQRDGLISFMDDLRTQAYDEILEQVWP